jgi:flavorubredoxin
MASILIAFATRTGATRKIGELIAEGLRFSGHTVKMMDIKDVKSENDLNGYDGYVFGSATYHGDMMQTMKTFLFLAEKAALAGKVGGSFGAFGWSGEAPERIYGTMENIFQMDMVGGALMLKSADLGGGIAMAQDYGRRLAAKFK